MGAAHDTTVAIAGAGPAGMMLALLLARQGVPVTVVEAHRDFDREFRGDMIHPSTLQVLHEIGLADRLHALPHAKWRSLRFQSASGTTEMASFAHLPTRFPYVMVMPQARFLEFLAAEAQRFPGFRLLTGTAVTGLVEIEGVVRGLTCGGPDGGEIRAALSVGADGRASKARRAAGLRATSQSRPMEVVWCAVPRLSTDPVDEGCLYFAAGRVVVLIGRPDDWQVGCVVKPGTSGAVRRNGPLPLVEPIADVVPWMRERIRAVGGRGEVSVLRVEADRVISWHRPGLLLIGDAAHAMLPVGGVGINCAVADAVEAANVLARPLLAGAVTSADLARVQHRREGLTAVVQRFQRMQHRVLDRALSSTGPVHLPLALRVALRVPGLRRLPARIMGLGLRPVHVEAHEPMVVTRS